jgi:glucose-6-phosphate dehydrogenase assembly protein OpcA
MTAADRRGRSAPREVGGLPPQRGPRAGETWEGTSVDGAAIEAALAQLWTQAGHRPEGGRRQPPIRSSVMNLVVYVSRAEDAVLVTDAIAALTERHPSRTICVVTDPNAPTSSLDASVTTHCGTAHSGRLCWEQIHITAHGATAAHVPGVVIPLVRPDLPTYLWWIGAVPYEAELFRHMVDLCDRLIVDSGFFARPVEGLAQLAAHKQRTAGDRGVGDVHWMRLTPWRNLAAQFFDGEELRPYASCIDSVRLGYTHDEQTHGGLGQALLLAGWLTSCLGWSPRPRAAWRHGDTVHLEAERPAEGRSGTVAIDIRRQATGELSGFSPIATDALPPTASATGPGGPGCRAAAASGRLAPSADMDGLVSLRLTATLQGVPGVFAMERRPQSSEATTTTTIGSVQGAARMVRMAPRSLAELLYAELEMWRHDRLYEAALAAAAALTESLVMEQE